MNRRIIGALLAVAAIMSTPPSLAQAYELYPAAFSNGAIADGTLHVCFEDNSPVYTHRAGILVGIRTWSRAKDITFISNGRCGNDGSNIEVHWALLSRPCSRGAETSIVPPLYSTAYIYFNSACLESGFHWNSNAATPAGKWDSATVGMHEAGHALGIDHEDNPAKPPDNNVLDLMDEAPCAFGVSSYLSSDDAAAIRARYPGLSNNGNNGMFTQFKSPAPCWD